MLSKCFYGNPENCHKVEGGHLNLANHRDVTKRMLMLYVIGSWVAMSRVRQCTVVLLRFDFGLVYPLNIGGGRWVPLYLFSIGFASEKMPK